MYVLYGVFRLKNMDEPHGQWWTDKFQAVHAIFLLMLSKIYSLLKLLKE